MKLFTFLLSVLLTINCTGQFELQWDRQVPIDPYNAGYMRFDQNDDVIITRGLVSGGGFVQLGLSIAKFDIDGNQIWHVVDTEFNDGYNFGMLDFQVDHANNIILSGFEMSPEDFYTNAAIIKLDQNGSEIWRAALGVPWSWSERVSSIALDGDDNIYATATLYYEPENTIVTSLIKLNAAGEVLWTRFDEYMQGYNEVVMGPDNHLYVSGYETLRKYDLNGNPIWSVSTLHDGDLYGYTEQLWDNLLFSNDRVYLHTFNTAESSNPVSGITSVKLDGTSPWHSQSNPAAGQNSSMYSRGFCKDAANNIYIVGVFNVVIIEQGPTLAGLAERGKGGESEHYMFVSQILANGQPGWTRTFLTPQGVNFNPFPANIIWHENQVAFVYIEPMPESLAQGTIGLNPQNGEVLWTQTVTEAAGYTGLFPEHLAKSSTGSIYVSGRGEAEDFSQGLYLNKYELPGIVDGVQEVALPYNIRIYPNPASQTLQLSYEGRFQSYRITQTTGALVKEEKIQSPNNQTVDISALASGTYMLTLMDTDKRVSVPFCVR